ncbi:hypothetical protein RDI58_009999 [Solanum bulbocastanum]|uniref:Uncharacterized protein n=1 Tax=Solanum bulbocastanum TaxID=147425 RepID=A0AAN8YJ11_SOLBU
MKSREPPCSDISEGLYVGGWPCSLDNCHLVILLLLIVLVRCLGCWSLLEIIHFCVFLLGIQGLLSQLR